MVKYSNLTCASRIVTKKGQTRYTFVDLDNTLHDTIFKKMRVRNPFLVDLVHRSLDIRPWSKTIFIRAKNFEIIKKLFMWILLHLYSDTHCLLNLYQLIQNTFLIFTKYYLIKKLLFHFHLMHCWIMFRCSDTITNWD